METQWLVPHEIALRWWPVESDGKVSWFSSLVIVDEGEEDELGLFGPYPTADQACEAGLAYWGTFGLLGTLLFGGSPDESGEDE